MKYEYNSITTCPGNLNNALNVWAKEGWELISILKIESAPNTTYLCVFKREAK